MLRERSDSPRPTIKKFRQGPGEVQDSFQTELSRPSPTHRLTGSRVPDLSDQGSWAGGTLFWIQALTPFRKITPLHNLDNKRPRFGRVTKAGLTVNRRVGEEGKVGSGESRVCCQSSSRSSSFFPCSGSQVCSITNHAWGRNSPDHQLPKLCQVWGRKTVGLFHFKVHFWSQWKPSNVDFYKEWKEGSPRSLQTSLEFLWSSCLDRPPTSSPGSLHKRWGLRTRSGVWVPACARKPRTLWFWLRQDFLAGARAAPFAAWGFPPALTRASSP